LPIYRDYVIRDILPAGTSEEVRRQLIDEAVREVLDSFLC
jgi:hypothetical protein